MSGVVVFRLSKPTNIRSLVVSVAGHEVPVGASFAHALRGAGLFFRREQILSGMDQPRRTSERLSQLWNAFLGRDPGRTLSAGEHTYLFSLPLPASLPPSYNGTAGSITYTVIARVRYPLKPSTQTCVEVPVVYVPRVHRERPVALSYPNAGGAVQTGDISVNLELPQRNAEMGRSIDGRFTVNNPKYAQISAVTMSLESCEWVRLATERELQRQSVDSHSITPENPTAPVIEGDFELKVPSNAVPSVEGTAISVIWLLKLYLDTDPPLELKTPITVYAPITE